MLLTGGGEDGRFFDSASIDDVIEAAYDKLIKL